MQPLADLIGSNPEMEVARAASRVKPLIIVKSGGTAAGARAASSHTGTLAGPEKSFGAAFRQSGVIRAESIEELFDFARAFARPKERRYATAGELHGRFAAGEAASDHDHLGHGGGGGGGRSGGMLARVGVKVNLMAQTKALYFGKVLKPAGYQTSFYLLGWTPGTLDSHNVLFDIMGCRDDAASNRGESNLGNYCNKQLDALTDKILVEPDPAKRDLMIKQAYDISLKDYAYIPLHQQSLAWGVSKKVKITQRADNQVLFYWATRQE